MTSMGSVVSLETGKAAGNGAFDPAKETALTFSATSPNGSDPEIF